MALTKLEAVNIMLDAIGEDSVASLESGLGDAETAERILDEKTGSVLEKGWHVNTEKNYRLIPDLSGNINLPLNTLRADAVGQSAHLNVVVRKNGATRRLYNVTDHTYTFSSPVYVDLVALLTFEECPTALQNYIVARASRAFQQRTVSSAALDEFLREAEDDAWAALLDAEAETEDANILRDSVSVRQVVWRNNPYSMR